MTSQILSCYTIHTGHMSAASEGDHSCPLANHLSPTIQLRPPLVGPTALNIPQGVYQTDDHHLSCQLKQSCHKSLFRAIRVSICIRNELWLGNTPRIQPTDPSAYSIEESLLTSVDSWYLGFGRPRRPKQRLPDMLAERNQGVATSNCIPRQTYDICWSFLNAAINPAFDSVMEPSRNAVNACVSVDGFRGLLQGTSHPNLPRYRG